MTKLPQHVCPFLALQYKTYYTNDLNCYNNPLLQPITPAFNEIAKTWRMIVKHFNLSAHKINIIYQGNPFNDEMIPLLGFTMDELGYEYQLVKLYEIGQHAFSEESVNLIIDDTMINDRSVQQIRGTNIFTAWKDTYHLKTLKSCQSTASLFCNSLHVLLSFNNGLPKYLFKNQPIDATVSYLLGSLERIAYFLYIKNPREQIANAKPLTYETSYRQNAVICYYSKNPTQDRQLAERSEWQQTSALLYESCNLDVSIVTLHQKQQCQSSVFSKWLHCIEYFCDSKGSHFNTTPAIDPDGNSLDFPRSGFYDRENQWHEWQLQQDAQQDQSCLQLFVDGKEQGLFATPGALWPEQLQEIDRYLREYFLPSVCQSTVNPSASKAILAAEDQQLQGILTHHDMLSDYRQTRMVDHQRSGKALQHYQRAFINGKTDVLASAGTLKPVRTDYLICAIMANNDCEAWLQFAKTSRNPNDADLMACILHSAQHNPKQLKKIQYYIKENSAHSIKDIERFAGQFKEADRFGIIANDFWKSRYRNFCATSHIISSELSCWQSCEISDHDQNEIAAWRTIQTRFNWQPNPLYLVYVENHFNHLSMMQLIASTMTTYGYVVTLLSWNQIGTVKIAENAIITLLSDPFFFKSDITPEDETRYQWLKDHAATKLLLPWQTPVDFALPQWWNMSPNRFLRDWKPLQVSLFSEPKMAMLSQNGLMPHVFPQTGTAPEQAPRLIHYLQRKAENYHYTPPDLQNHLVTLKELWPSTPTPRVYICCVWEHIDDNAYQSSLRHIVSQFNRAGYEVVVNGPLADDSRFNIYLIGGNERLFKQATASDFIEHLKRLKASYQQDPFALLLPIAFEAGDLAGLFPCPLFADGRTWNVWRIHDDMNPHLKFFTPQTLTTQILPTLPEKAPPPPSYQELCPPLPPEYEETEAETEETASLLTQTPEATHAASREQQQVRKKDIELMINMSWLGAAIIDFSGNIAVVVLSALALTTGLPATGMIAFSIFLYVMYAFDVLNFVIFPILSYSIAHAIKHHSDDTAEKTVVCRFWDYVTSSETDTSPPQNLMP